MRISSCSRLNSFDSGRFTRFCQIFIISKCFPLLPPATTAFIQGSTIIPRSVSSQIQHSLYSQYVSYDTYTENTESFVFGLIQTCKLLIRPRYDKRKLRERKCIRRNSNSAELGIRVYRVPDCTEYQSAG